MVKVIKKVGLRNVTLFFLVGSSLVGRLLQNKKYVVKIVDKFYYICYNLDTKNKKVG